jgi:hypothetical protein
MILEDWRSDNLLPSISIAQDHADEELTLVLQ